MPNMLEFNSFFRFFLPFSFYLFCFHPLSWCSTMTSIDLCLAANAWIIFAFGEILWPQLET